MVLQEIRGTKFKPYNEGILLEDWKCLAFVSL